MRKYFANINKSLALKNLGRFLFGQVYGLYLKFGKVFCNLRSIAVPFFMFVSIMLPLLVYAEYSLEQLRIANVLANEVGNSGESHMRAVAEVMRNRYNEQNKKYNRNNITYSDILFHSYGGASSDSDFSGARKKFANKDKETLMKMGRSKMGSDAGWNMALNFASQMLKGTLTSNITNGANSFHGCSKKYTTVEQAKVCLAKNEGPATYLDIISGASRNHIYHIMEQGKFTHKYDSDTVAEITEGGTYSPSSVGTSSSDSDGSSESGSCAMEAMKKMYLTDDSKVDQYCWYCKIVIVLVNAYLSAANDALAATISLGKMILKLGFLIWLGYYLLQQVSSMKAVTPGKMLQDILVMGFKVALAYAAVGMGTQLIRDYYLDPIVGTGVDYGLALFKQMNVAQGLGG